MELPSTSSAANSHTTLSPASTRGDLGSASSASTSTSTCVTNRTSSSDRSTSSTSSGGSWIRSSKVAGSGWVHTVSFGSQPASRSPGAGQEEQGQGRARQSFSGATSPLQGTAAPAQPALSVQLIPDPSTSLPVHLQHSNSDLDLPSLARRLGSPHAAGPSLYGSSGSISIRGSRSNPAHGWLHASAPPTSARWRARHLLAVSPFLLPCNSLGAGLQLEALPEEENEGLDTTGHMRKSTLSSRDPTRHGSGPASVTSRDPSRHGGSGSGQAHAQAPGLAQWGQGARGLRRNSLPHTPLEQSLASAGLGGSSSAAWLSFLLDPETELLELRDPAEEAGPEDHLPGTPDYPPGEGSGHACGSDAAQTSLGQGTPRQRSTHNSVEGPVQRLTGPGFVVSEQIAGLLEACSQPVGDGDVNWSCGL